MSNFSVNQNHPMIPNNQNFKLDRKLISVHSEDRDVSKWPNVNEFEVKLPVDLKNVSSLRLMDVQFPVNYYVFSNNYQNTKFTYKVLPTVDVVVPIWAPLTYNLDSLDIPLHVPTMFFHPDP